jgi:CHC2 zinc finger
MMDKALLPPPKTFYERELGRLTRADRKGWAKGNCPFHESKSRTSFNVNVDHGGFYCFGCQTKGGDLIAFLRKRDGLTFRQACLALNCWTDIAPTAKDVREIERARKERARKAELEEQIENDIHRIRMETRDTIHSLHKCRRTFAPEGVWSNVLEHELRLAEGTYDLLSFSPREMQVQFLVLDADGRNNYVFDSLVEGRV